VLMSSAILRTVGALAVFVAVCLTAGAGQAKKANEYTKPAFNEDEAISASRNAVGREVGNYTFRNRFGKSVTLNSFRGKPLILSFIYTSCPQFCPMISQTILRSVEVGLETFGDDTFNIVSIGFDTKIDNPNRMLQFAESQGLDLKNWFFLSASNETIKGLTKDLGFAYSRSPSGFDHLAQTTIIDANGVVANQVYGTDFEVPFLIEPLKDQIYGRNAQLTSVEGLVNRVRLFCTVFDPKTGGYSFDFSIFISLAMGGSALGFIFIFLVRSWYRIWREGQARKSVKST
jgi:protein SCO1